MDKYLIESNELIVQINTNNYFSHYVKETIHILKTGEKFLQIPSLTFVQGKKDFFKSF